MEPQIRFCTAADGTRIGYGVMGSGAPLVLVYSWGNNIETEWENPACRAAHERLASDRRCITVMRRGIDPSQRDVEDLSLAAQMSDIAAVAGALNLDTFDLWAFSDGAGPVVAFAAENPGRVSKLILWSAYTRGAELIDDAATRGLVELIRTNWSVATRTFANMAFPSGPVDEQRWLARQFRQSITPETAARYLEFLAKLDLTAYLPRVQAPTLVLHRRKDRVAPLAAGRAVAAQIPNARFVTLEGDIAYSWLGDISYLDIVAEFLAEGRTGAGEGESSSPFRTVLFTDVESHTAMMQRLGDARGREVLREHERRTREALRTHGGTEVKAMGDGFMASFGSAQKALECAIALQEAFVESDCAGEAIRIRIGLNAGEPIAEDNDLFGSSVIMAARAAAKAEGGQILVTNVVRELVAGKGFLFADAGDFELRGFEDPVKLYLLRWDAG
jgi:class 3 adenylate cyclase/pimeloyl-ACP methyl ester carboxylesterase